MAEYDVNSFTGQLEGTNYGLGVEHMIRDNFSVGLEYLQRQMDVSPSAGFDYDGSSIALRPSYRF